MATSANLKTETAAMRKVEAAMSQVESLPPKARDRVFAWIEATYFDADEG